MLQVPCYARDVRSMSTSTSPYFPILLLGLFLLSILLIPVKVPSERPYQTVVVLGAAQYAGRPSPAFKRRLDHAYELYWRGGIRHIVVTGGRIPGDSTTEGEVGVQYLHSLGVPWSVLSAETESRTTIANLRNAKSQINTKSITLVTDKAHAARALALAKALGFQANVNASPLLHPPSWYYITREKLALLAYIIVGVRS